MKTKKIIVTIISSIFSLLSYSQVQTQNLNMGLYQLQFPSANGGNNRIQSYGGTFPGKWELKSRFDHIYIDAGENASNQFDLIFLNGGLEGARLKSNGYFGIGTSNPSTKLSIEGDNESISVASGTFTYSSANPIGAQFGTWSENGVAGIKFHRWLGTGSLFHAAYIGQALYNSNYGLDFRTNSLSSFGDATTSRMYIHGSTGNVGIGTTNPRKKLEINGDIVLENYTGIKQIFTWSPDDSNWRIGMNENPGFNRSMLTGHVQYLTYGQGLTQGFSVGVNGGESSLEIKGFDHTAFFRGNVGIGTTNPDAKLTVKGNIHTQEVKVDLLGAVAPDYVFHKDYDLKSLKTVEDYIANNGHLPNIPSAKDMETEGIMLKEMNLKLLEKIEELTLYAIEQEKRIDTLVAISNTLKTQEKRIAELEEKLVLLLNKN